MTEEEFNILKAEGDPGIPEGWTWADVLKAREHRERVRQFCVEEYENSPLWKARAEKDPNYWKTFYVGRYTLADGWKPKHEREADEAAN